MKIWFQCKVKYQKEDETGKVKNVTEPYLVDAVSYTEAEARIYQELGSIIRGEFEVPSITKSKIVDIFHYDDNDVWYLCKVTYVVADENSGKEKKITQQMLVTADNVREAYDRIHESLSNMLITFQVPEIKESPIVEIFPYISDEDKPQVIPDNLKPLSEVEEKPPVKQVPTREDVENPVAGVIDEADFVENIVRPQAQDEDDDFNEEYEEEASEQYSEEELEEFRRESEDEDYEDSESEEVEVER